MELALFSSIDIWFTKLLLLKLLKDCTSSNYTYIHFSFILTFFLVAQLVVKSVDLIVLLQPSIIIFRRFTFYNWVYSIIFIIFVFSTTRRENFKSIDTFIEEADSRTQCATLEDNIKEFGLTYFGMDDTRQGKSIIVQIFSFSH